MQELGQLFHTIIRAKSDRIMPNFAHELKFPGPVAGIDEAGRGPLAGPVVAAAVILDAENIPDGLNDSKALSPTQRECILNMLRQTANIGIGIAGPAEIDQFNILQATFKAMQRALAALPTKPCAAIIDGNRCPDLPCEARAIIKGDSQSLSIAAASIVAKVTRDALMKQADILYPYYGFAAHKGYPTAAHKAALNKHGPCPIHRFGYKPVILARSLAAY